MARCCVPLCKGRGTFSFPKNEERKLLWEHAIHDNFKSSKSSRLCSHHFKDDDIIQNQESYYTGIKHSRRFLKSTAVPSRNLKREKQSLRAEKIRKTLFGDDPFLGSESSSISSSFPPTSTSIHHPSMEHSLEFDIDTHAPEFHIRQESDLPGSNPILEPKTLK